MYLDADDLVWKVTCEHKDVAVVPVAHLSSSAPVITGLFTQKMFKFKHQKLLLAQGLLN